MGFICPLFLIFSMVFVIGLLIGTNRELSEPGEYSHLLNDPNLIIPIRLVVELAFFKIGISTKMQYQLERAVVQRYEIQELL